MITEKRGSTRGKENLGAHVGKLTFPSIRSNQLKVSPCPTWDDDLGPTIAFGPVKR